MNLPVTIPYASVRWLTLFGAIVFAWVVMFAMSLPPADPLLAGDTAGSLRHAHHLSVADVSFVHLLVMWALMALAMMAPSLVPALRTFDDLLEAGAGTRAAFFSLIGGYLAAWLGYALAATWLQMNLAEAALIDTDGRSLSLWLNAGLLGLAGIYQFSPLKEACLNSCRMPLSYFMARWRDGATGAFAMGLRLGLICVLCCWALMLLGFVGGVMSLLWMGAATLLMTFEKLPQIGRYLTRPLGVILLTAGAATAVSALYLNN